MQLLPAHYRKVIMLYRIEQRPLAEVAAEMGRTKGATCRLIARAMEMLRKGMLEP
jgi:DNA-directed RNA polymerase specialized sigma24 family protein